MKPKKSFHPRWMTLREIMKTHEVKSFGITELDVVRWSREGKISHTVVDGKKNYDLNEVMGFALALTSGWLLEEEEQP